MRTTIQLTQEQTDQLRPFYQELTKLLIAGSRGYLMAQPVYPSTLTVALISAEQGDAIQKIMNVSAEIIESDRSHLEKHRQRLQGIPT